MMGSHTFFLEAVLVLLIAMTCSALPVVTKTSVGLEERRLAPPALPKTYVRKLKRANTLQSSVIREEEEDAFDVSEQDVEDARKYAEEAGIDLDEVLGEFDELVDKNDSCFPASSTVTISGAAPIRMEALAVGDSVSVGNTDSRVFMFTHSDRDGMHPFVRLTTASGHALSLSAGHYLYANDALEQADTVRTGDLLRLAAGGESPVVAVGATVERGLYNPQTLHGDIAVNGIVSSTYTSAIEPGLAHALLLPARAAYEWLGYSTRLLDGGAPKFMKDTLLPLGTFA